MISETAGAGIIRQDVQQAIERELSYRLGQGDAPGALSRWQKELLLLVISAVESNACLSQLHARAAIKAGARLDQVLQTILYIELTGMVKWVMVGGEAFAAAEADATESQRQELAKGGWSSKERRLEEIKQYLLKDGHRDISDEWKKLVQVAPGILDGYIRMRESFVKPDPLGALPKKMMELVIISADIVQDHPWGAVRHTERAISDGATVPEIIESVALAMIECGVQTYKTAGLEVIEAAERIASGLA